ncbi:MAG: monovalent cation/H(+) antiporter subunit G [Caldisericia bacterium]|nr:monovalent cation/H(+) antiporter subunit G [Caldisericia bacterium]MDD4614593.1 monovalent cation/H(+) antiporter subunit G [Caldisericia bacterium]
MTEIVSNIFIFIGVVFMILGCVGLVRLPDVYNRLQAATKSVTLGVCSMLLGVIILKGFSPMSGKAFLCIVFILITSPTSAHALARGAYKSKVRLCKNTVCDQYDFGRKEELTIPQNPDEESQSKK